MADVRFLEFACKMVEGHAYENTLDFERFNCRKLTKVARNLLSRAKRSAGRAASTLGATLREVLQALHAQQGRRPLVKSGVWSEGEIVVLDIPV